jgi:DNA polymerase-4
VLLEKAKDLFTKLYKRGLKVRLLGVKFSHLVPMTFQMNLFDKSVEKLQLFKAVDTIKDQFGSGVIMKATGLQGKKKGQK